MILTRDDIAFDDLTKEEKQRLTEVCQISKGDTVQIVGESGEHHGLAVGTEALVIKPYEAHRPIGRKYTPEYLGGAWEIVTNETGDTYWVYEASVVSIYSRKQHAKTYF